MNLSQSLKLFLHQVLLITLLSFSRERHFRHIGWHTAFLVPHMVILNEAGQLGMVTVTIYGYGRILYGQCTVTARHRTSPYHVGQLALPVRSRLYIRQSYGLLRVRVLMSWVIIYYKYINYYISRQLHLWLRFEQVGGAVWQPWECVWCQVQGVLFGVKSRHGHLRKYARLQQQILVNVKIKLNVGL